MGLWVCFFFKFYSCELPPYYSTSSQRSGCWFLAGRFLRGRVCRLFHFSPREGRTIRLTHNARSLFSSFSPLTLLHRQGAFMLRRGAGRIPYFSFECSVCTTLDTESMEGATSSVTVRVSATPHSLVTIFPLICCERKRG